MSRPPRRLPAWGVALVALALLGTAMVVPTLVGVLSVDLVGDLGFGEVGLGAAISTFWLATAALAPLAGRVADAVGWVPVAVLGALASGAALVSVAGWVTSWPTLAVAMVVAASGYALCSPTSNLLVMRAVAPGRQARVLGIKQCAPPLLLALAGAAVPWVAVTHGWRWAMASGLVLPVVLLAGVLSLSRVGVGAGAEGPRPGHRVRAARPLRSAPVVVAAGLGTLSVATVSAFAVLTLTHVGFTPVHAAGVVSVGSVVALVVRLASSWLLDARAEESLGPLVAVMLAAAVSLAAVATGLAGVARAPQSSGPGVWGWVVAVGLVVALVAAWTWPALLLLAVVRRAAAPGAASGLLQLGSGLGSAVGPLGFGFLSAHGGREVAWVVMAVSTGVAVGLVRRADRPRGGPALVRGG